MLSSLCRKAGYKGKIDDRLFMDDFTLIRFFEERSTMSYKAYQKLRKRLVKMGHMTGVFLKIQKFSKNLKDSIEEKKSNLNNNEGNSNNLLHRRTSSLDDA